MLPLVFSKALYSRGVPARFKPGKDRAVKLTTNSPRSHEVFRSDMPKGQAGVLPFCVLFQRLSETGSRLCKVRCVGRRLVLQTLTTIREMA